MIKILIDEYLLMVENHLKNEKMIKKEREKSRQ